jgi:hypothetical protein
VSTTAWIPREVAQRSERRERRVVVASANPLDLYDALLAEVDEASRRTP